MIISRTEIDRAVSAMRAARKRRPMVEAMSFDSIDSFERSEAAASMAELASEVAQQPLYRDALVSDLGRRIAEGKYFVPTEEIVEKLLGRLMLEAMPA